MIVTMLELRPGCVVLESGTGSGSLSTHLAHSICTLPSRWPSFPLPNELPSVPNGHVYTFEFHEQRSKTAIEDFKQNGLSNIITVECRDIVGLGFPERFHEAGSADAVFLDLPAPWSVVESAYKCLRPSGNFCSFSPCIEQVQRTCVALSKQGFYGSITSAPRDIL
jgi:tRNA (adenine57-N1/adenine58-N1)-methyltransferase